MKPGDSHHDTVYVHGSTIDDIVQIILASTPDSRWLLTGPIHSGKSEFLLRLIESIRPKKPTWRIGGVVTRGVFEDGQKVGYRAVNCLTGETFLVGMRKDIPNSLSFQISASTNVEELLRQSNVEIGDWLLFADSLERASNCIVEASRQLCDLVVIDEFGPLEANGLGLRTAIDSVLQSRCRTLVVVREQLLETAHALFAPISVMRIFPSASNT